MHWVRHWARVRTMGSQIDTVRHRHRVTDRGVGGWVVVVRRGRDRHRATVRG